MGGKLADQVIIDIQHRIAIRGQALDQLDLGIGDVVFIAQVGQMRLSDVGYRGDGRFGDLHRQFKLFGFDNPQFQQGVLMGLVHLQQGGGYPGGGRAVGRGLQHLVGRAQDGRKHPLGGGFSL